MIASKNNGFGHGIFVKPDGTKLYHTGTSTNAVFQYSLSTAFDITSTVTLDVNQNISSREDRAQDAKFNSDGTIVLVLGTSGDGIDSWSLSTPYDINTMTVSDNTFEPLGGNPRGFDARYIHDEAWGVRATPDGGCIITAGTGDEYEEYSERIGSERSDQWRVYMVKYGPEGSMEWQATYGDPEEDWAGEDLALTLDGGVIVAVDNAQFGFLKLSSY